MPKYLKYSLIAFATVLALVILMLVIIAATFNPNDYKPRLIELVHEKTQRTLSIPGDIRLTFFPRIGADLGVVALTEQRGSQVFASATHTHVAVALLPLLSRQFVADRVLVDGLTINLHRYKNNSTNYDDLAGKAGTVSDTRTTPTPASPQEKAKAALLDLGGIAISDMHVNYTDDTQGSKLSVHVVKLATGPVASGKSSPIELEAELASSPGNLKLSARLDGTVRVDLEKESVETTLSGRLDSTTLSAKLALQRFSQPSYTFDLTLGDLDADHYLVGDKPATAATPSAASGGAAVSDAVIDLSALKALNAKGSLQIAKLKVANIRAADIKLELRAAAGKVDIAPLSASLYDGSVTGALSAHAGTPQRFMAKLKLSNIRIAPLLKDAIDKDPLDGKGDIALDLVTSGASIAQLKKGLNGNASLNLKDGAVNGFNIAAALRKVKGSGTADEKTDFTEMNASFKINNGVAHNDDLSAKTPLFRLGGNGDINILDSSLDYTAKATVVPTLEGQGGPELQQLKGLTIPVRLSGPFSHIAWKVDFGNVAGNRVKELTDERTSQLKAEAAKRLEEEKARLQDRLKGLLGR